MRFSEKVLQFYSSLKLDVPLPEKVEVMNPYQNKNTVALCEKFYTKYYNETENRSLIVGINPGRLGGGLTGVPFTDPLKLQNECGIPNELQKKQELSADFIYQVIEAYGGTTKFYHNYFIGAVCPLGFTKDGKNLNYYDIKDLEKAVYPFIIESLKKQLALGITTEICFCLGEGKNFEFLSKVNQAHSFFKKIVPLPHPRFIMQYRRKKINDFIRLYVEKLSEV